MFYLLFLPLFFLVMYFYFQVADHYNIVDRPNERSSHTVLTIRGGGVIYLFAALVALVMHPAYWMFISGLFIIGVISFIDDRITLSSKLRILFHLIAVTLSLWSANVFNAYPWWVIPLLYILMIGIINAYNFMDGINGITGLYSLVLLFGVQFVNYRVVSFVNPDLIWLPILASLVFLFFILEEARCFAGDVGSVSIAFWIVTLLIILILKAADYRYILFLAVYGVDAVLTIIHRLYLRQNIFEAHRLHFYQLLANEQKIPHLLVSLMYAVVQLTVIAIVVFLKIDVFILSAIILIPLVAIYLIFKPILMK
ncbi:putative glycosyltransferase [Pedobacter sp. BAL39]|uniref:MraY family glycosyltransferase n=1 Tax=Pedobacter sp. BAL39 TaxID=391596 RepID=UPI0001559707|nr:glycosyltransferase family 4 protein [Pedobacter sp. BAL39]EDM37175.1 putative glycosyltransferase [Pedobacter sp. BAL39]